MSFDKNFPWKAGREKKNDKQTLFDWLNSWTFLSHKNLFYEGLVDIIISRIWVDSNTLWDEIIFSHGNFLIRIADKLIIISFRHFHINLPY